jgi:hypothetical protein
MRYCMLRKSEDFIWMVFSIPSSKAQIGHSIITSLFQSSDRPLGRIVRWWVGWNPRGHLMSRRLSRSPAGVTLFVWSPCEGTNVCHRRNEVDMQRRTLFQIAEFGWNGYLFGYDTDHLLDQILNRIEIFGWGTELFLCPKITGWNIWSVPYWNISHGSSRVARGDVPVCDINSVFKLSEVCT